MIRPSRKLTVLTLIGAIGTAAVAASTVPAAAELSPWEMFCFLTSDNGKELARCLDGLPSRPTGPQTFVAR
jgi:hypothetical protein